MSSFRPGQKVTLPVQVHGGPFPDQVLIRLEVQSGWRDGIIKRTELVSFDGQASGRIAGEVADVTDKGVKLKVTKAISGNFFSKSGVATLSLDQAENNLELIGNDA